MAKPINFESVSIYFENHLTPCKLRKRTFSEQPQHFFFSSTRYKFLNYSPTNLWGIQLQELGLVGNIGKHSQFQRNYKQNLAEMKPELWMIPLKSYTKCVNPRHIYDICEKT